MTGKRLQKRRKKQGKALFISRLIRLGMLATVLLTLLLGFVAVRAVFGLFSSPSPEDAAPPQITEPQEPSVSAVVRSRGTVVVDPGHGGSDPGCGEEPWLEKDIVLPISIHLTRLLEEAGVTVIMTRQEDRSLSLHDRAVLADTANADLFVSIHCNSYEGDARGMDCYYYKSEPAKQLAQDILDEAAALGITTRQIQKNNYQVLWDTDMPAVLVETGFLTDTEDRALLRTPAHQEKVAQAIVNAVLPWLDAQAA